MNTDFKILYISRVRFFDIVAKFPDIRDKIVEAGETYIRGRLSQDDVAKLLAAFPGSVWE